MKDIVRETDMELDHVYNNTIPQMTGPDEPGLISLHRRTFFFIFDIFQGTFEESHREEFLSSFRELIQENEFFRERFGTLDEKESFEEITDSLRERKDNILEEMRRTARKDLESVIVNI